MNKRHATVLSTLLGCGFSLIASSFVTADEVGDVNVDWLGSDIKIEAIEDPQSKGCHLPCIVL